MNSLKVWPLYFFIMGFAILQVSCANSNGGTTTGNPLAESDTSVSGAAAGAAGGALSNSSPNSAAVENKSATDTNIFSAVVPMSGTCPTFATPAGSTCSASGASMWLSYSACKFPNATATLSGTQILTMSSGVASCGTFPNPGANGTLYRQFVTSSGSTTPSSLLRQSAAGNYLAVDNHTANLSNFDSANLPAIVNGGYGTAVTFNSNGERSSITFGHRINTVGSFDQTVYGTLSIAESSLASATRTVSGTVTVYHNGLQVIGTSTFTNVVHSNTCCVPISGTITTNFSAGANSNPTLLGSRYVGKSEVLTLTGCGTGTLQNYDGTISSVSLDRCF